MATLGETEVPIAEKHLKPYQGLKHIDALYAFDGTCRKTPKTLSGIET